MKRAEVIKLIGLCSINYRKWPEEGKEEAIISLWGSMLSDVDFEVAQLAIKKFMSESVYPPTIADIRSRIADIQAPDRKSAIEAWGEVTHLIRKYGSYRQADALSEMSELTRKVVDHIGFRYLCMSENEMADRAHFMKAYDNLAERERKESLIPLEGRKLMEKLKLDNVLKRLPGA